MSKSAKRMSLKAFFEALEGCLDTLSAAALRSVIGNRAKAVPPDSRHAFLAKLEPGGTPEESIAAALGQDDLLSDIDDLALSSLPIRFTLPLPPASGSITRSVPSYSM